MAEVSGGTGKTGSGRRVAAGVASEAKLGTGAKRKSRAGKSGRRQERNGSKLEGGADRLKEAVDRKLKGSSLELAKLLMDKARSGDMPSIRLLVSLAGQHKPKAKVGENMSVLGFFGNQLRAWAAEPEWVDPPEEGEEQQGSE